MPAAPRLAVDLVFVGFLLRERHLRILKDNGLADAAGRLLQLLLVLAAGAGHGGQTGALLPESGGESGRGGRDANGGGGGGARWLDGDLNLCRKQGFKTVSLKCNQLIRNMKELCFSVQTCI